MRALRTFVVALAVVAVGSVGFAGGNKDAGLIKIGAIQLVEHPALDASYRGFVDALAAAGYIDGKNIAIDFQNAQGEQANCVTIADKFANDRVDLILAIATPAAQAVANRTSTIPVVVTAVTDPESAKLVKSNAAPGTNVTGTSDLTPVAAQIGLLKRLIPGAKTVGLLYCSSEQNSVFQIDLAKAACRDNGLAFIDATAVNSNEVQQAVQSLVGKVQAVYAPTDNLMASSMPVIAQVTTAAKLPLIVGEENMMKAGGLATYGINYYELGKQTGAMAVDILKTGKKPAAMPIQYLEKADLSVNTATASAIGVTIPADLK
jgi:putative ABC transport system substrate-binding protein